jgi:hypothetical protein
MSDRPMPETGSILSDSPAGGRWRTILATGFVIVFALLVFGIVLRARPGASDEFSSTGGR